MIRRNFTAEGAEIPEGRGTFTRDCGKTFTWMSKIRRMGGDLLMFQSRILSILCIHVLFRQILIFAALLTGLLLPLPARSLDLDKALRLARANAVELAEIEADLQRARAEASIVFGAYDSGLFGNTRWLQDSSEQVSTFAGDRRDQTQGEFGFRKLLPTATLLQTSVKHLRDYTKYPPAPEPDPTAPPGTGALAFDVSQFQSFNPAYATRLEVLVKQPLWRNRFGRELDLQEELASLGILEPTYRRRIVLQAVQAETEGMYWTLAALEARLNLMEDLLRASRRFAGLMARRTEFGRADQVDVASAESAVVVQEGAVLELKLAAEDVRKRLAIRLADGSDLKIPPHVLERGALPAASTDPHEARKLAREQRADLGLILESLRPVRVQEKLAREEGRPSLSFVGSVASNGLEDGAAASAPDAFNDGNHLTYLVGLELDVNLGRTASREKLRAASARMASLEARARVLRRDIDRDIDLAFQALDAARQRIEQADRNVAGLQAKRDAEQKKFLQARSEEIAVLRYDMEITAAKVDRVSALQEIRQTEARIRHALHAYASEENP